MSNLLLTGKPPELLPTMQAVAAGTFITLPEIIELLQACGVSNSYTVKIEITKSFFGNNMTEIASVWVPGEGYIYNANRDVSEK